MLCQYTKLPSSVLGKIDQIQRNFIWGSSTSKRKLHLLSWDKITMRKPERGLGIQQALHKNMTMLSKLAWRTFTNPESLWASVILSKYTKEVLHNKSITKPTHNMIWKHLMAGWDACRKEIVTT